MSDLISRQDAINAMMALKQEDDESYGCEIPEGFDGKRAVEALEKLPSAEPERKKGAWIYDTERVACDGWTYSQYHCSECGFQELGWLANFCPHCGADMTRGENGQA